MNGITHNMRRRIFIMLTIIWMIVIFAFSAKDADESDHASYEVGLTIGRIFIVDFEKQPVEEQLAFAASVDHPVRKTAHVLEYAVLGFLVMGAIYGLSIKWYIQCLIAWALATLYATTDEIHQLFVPGRSGEFKDVCIDSAGVLLGVLIGMGILHIIHRLFCTQKVCL